ncbi:MAG: hypothetical protein WHV67_06905 [Thermoanaerobaculia bacterium]
MKNCEELLLEFGIDYLEGEKTPEEIENHFRTCQDCIEKLEKQRVITGLLEEKVFRESPLKIDFPPVLRKRDRLPFLSLSIFFLFFFLIFHSILNTEFLKPYILIITHLNLIPSLKITGASLFLMIIISSLSLGIIFQLKKFLKKL